MIYTETDLAVLRLFHRRNITSKNPVEVGFFSSELHQLLGQDSAKVKHAISFADSSNWIEERAGGHFLVPTLKAETLMYWRSQHGGNIGMELEEKKAARFRFLKGLYDEVDGARNSMVNAIELGNKLGFSTELSHDICQYLSDEGLLEFAALGGIIRITHRGIIEIEDAQSHPESETHYFPPVNYISNVINIHGNNAAPIQAGTVNSSQVSQIDVSDPHEVAKWIQDLEATLEHQKIDNDEVRDEIETVKSLLATRKPRMDFVRSSLSAIRSILTGMASNAAFEALLAALPL